VRQQPSTGQQVCWEHETIHLAGKSEKLPAQAGQRLAWKGFSTNAAGPGENLGKSTDAKRLDGTDTLARKGIGADEEPVMGTCPTTLGAVASHIQAKKMEATLLRWM